MAAAADCIGHLVKLLVKRSMKIQTHRVSSRLQAWDTHAGSHVAECLANPATSGMSVLC